MKKAKKFLINIVSNRFLVVLIISFSLFIVSIIVLFTKEKSSLDSEYTEVISKSLSTQTAQEALALRRQIREAANALVSAEFLLQENSNEDPKILLQRYNENNLSYPITFTDSETIENDGLTSLIKSSNSEAVGRFEKWSTVLSDIYFNENIKSEAIDIMIPKRVNNEISHVISTHIDIGTIMRNRHEVATYKDVSSIIMNSAGEVIFTTYVPTDNIYTNLYDYMHSIGLDNDSVEQMKKIISTSEVESLSFKEDDRTYFTSAVSLSYNDWHLVTFAKNPDVLLGSDGTFHDIVRISAITILITVVTFGFIFVQLIFSKKKLEAQQDRNHALSKKLGGMFDQHNVINIIFDANKKTITEVNSAACNYFGLDRKDFIGRHISEFNLLSNEQLYKDLSLSAGGSVTVPSVPHRLSDGTIKFLDIYYSIINDGHESFIYSILFDVTDKVQYKEELIREKEYLRTTLQSIADGVVTTDTSGVITGINLTGEQLIGCSSSEIIKKSFSDVFILRNEKTGAIEENPIQKVLDTNNPVGLSYNKVLVNVQGITIPIADSAAPIKSKDGKTTGVVMIFRNITSDKENHARIRFLSYYDSLTGVFNRYYFEKILNKMEDNHHRVTVMAADVNGLNITNNIFGHKTGDKLLKEVVKLIKSYCKEEDIIARWGGDEFIVLMPTTEIEEAEQIAQRIKDNTIVLEGINLSLSVSLGCAYADGGKGSVSQALQQAEKNMSQQKLLNNKSYRNTIISSLLATLYENSTETESHSKRMEHYCHAIGEKMHLPLKVLDELSLLALLHDIGKVAINPSILKKPGPLTEDEWVEMKKHPEIGYRIVKESQELSEIADFVLSHHEKWDGSGYPQGLKGTEIPLHCRILSLVDSYDAMTNDRVYRKAMSKEAAILELQRESGKQFDPEITEIFIDILTNEKET